MSENELKWNVLSRKTLLETRVFDVEERETVNEDCNIRGNYTVLNAPQWVNVVARVDGKFLMVRQYRHGLGKITCEFPGGVCDDAKEPIEETARRELLEETGYFAKTMINMGTFNPNPALFTNNVTFFLAKDLEDRGQLSLDADEVLKNVRISKEELLENIGKGEFVHAFLGTAVLLYELYSEKQ